MAESKKNKVFGRILVPIDGSELSFKALDVGVRLASAMGSGLHAINVFSMPSFSATATEIRALEESKMQERKWMVERALEAGKKARVKVKAELLAGNPAEKILGYIEREKIDLVIMGSSGLGQIRSLMMGSTTYKVSHHARCAVLIIK